MTKISVKSSFAIAAVSRSDKFMQSRNPPVYALHAGDPNPEERHNESLNFFYIMSTFGGRNRGHKNCLSGGIPKNKMEIQNGIFH